MKYGSSFIPSDNLRWIAFIVTGKFEPKIIYDILAINLVLEK
jgi:hypothetical protein